MLFDQARGVVLGFQLTSLDSLDGFAGTKLDQVVGHGIRAWPGCLGLGSHADQR
jgi:hypothetical protein